MIKALSKKLPLSNQPASAVESLIFLVILAVVAGLVILQVGHFLGRHRDSERKADLAALQEKVESYHALNGRYPASLQAAGNLTPQFCRSPGGHGNCQHPDYTYKAFKAGSQPSVTANQDCDNKKVACAGYILYSDSMEQTTNPYYLRSY